jgi:hypothetical protein
MTLAEQINRIDPGFWPACQAAPMCDIDGEFMGFTKIYQSLALIIPRGRTVVDLGCGYGCQAIFFQRHKKYIGVDLPGFQIPHLKTRNSEYFLMTIRQWIETELQNFDPEELFAICSYVPPWYDDNQDLVRTYFKHLFVFYPTKFDSDDVTLRIQKASVEEAQ